MYEKGIDCLTQSPGLEGRVSRSRTECIRQLKPNLDWVQNGNIHLHGPGCCNGYYLRRRYYSICDVRREDDKLSRIWVVS